MALTKATMVEMISQELGLSMKKSKQAIEALLEIVKCELEAGGDVLISNFGKFSVKDKKERRGRNPATGDDKLLRARRVVTFKYSGNLRKRLNGKYSDDESILRNANEHN